VLSDFFGRAVLRPPRVPFLYAELRPTKSGR
jgi:hypothetical protein